MKHNPCEPDPRELALLQLQARLRRLEAKGLTREEALAKIVAGESASEYMARNSDAIDEIQRTLFGAEYLARFEDANNEANPAERERKLAVLKRENYATLDIEALHRVIGARNRHLKAEGVLPRDPSE